VARSFRRSISPNFTPNKIKKIFSMTQKSITCLEDYMDALLLKSDCVNCTNITKRLIIDIIGRSLIDVDMMTLSIETNETNKFLSNLEPIFDSKRNATIYNILNSLFPQLCNFFHSKKTLNFYMDFIIDLMKYRKKHNIVKSDFVGSLTQLKGNSKELDENIGKIIFLLVCLLILSCFIFTRYFTDIILLY